MNNRKNLNNKKIFKWVKDYLVPIVIVFIVIIIVIGNYMSKTPTNQNDNLSKSFLNISLWSPGAESYVEYTWGKKAKIEWETPLYKSEKIQVVSDNVLLSDDNVKFNLNKLWELKYNEDWSYTLYSSDLWWDVKNTTNIEMRYAKVNVTNWVFSLSQNEVASTIFVVSWNVEVKNLVWNSTILKKWEKLVIMRNDTNDKNKDLSLSKELIDDYTKNDDWFVKNNWNYYLSQIDLEDTLSWSTNSWSTTNQINQGWVISFNNLYDEWEVLNDKIEISWNILDDRVNTININWINAEINSQNKTFLIKDINVSNKVNDIVYKIYDSNSSLINKWILTLYNSKWNTTWSTTNSSWLAKVENYPITTSPLYQIITPKQNPYTTLENVVRIEWTIPARTVSKIVVNDFELQKFVKNSSYWQYFANSEFWNLKPWVNIYKIKFYWEWDNILYETNFTIIKQEESKAEENIKTQE